MEENKLVYTQTWSDVIMVLVILALIFSIFYFSADSGDSRRAWIFTFLFISFLYVTIYAFIAIRRIEFYSDKIIVQFTKNNTVIINKDQIKSIEIKYRPPMKFLSRSKNSLTVFTFDIVNREQLSVPIFYGIKKFSINNNLFSDKATGEETYKVISFLKQYYSDKIIRIDPQLDKIGSINNQE